MPLKRANWRHSGFSRMTSKIYSSLEWLTLPVSTVKCIIYNHNVTKWHTNLAFPSCSTFVHSDIQVHFFHIFFVNRIAFKLTSLPRDEIFRGQHQQNVADSANIDKSTPLTFDLQISGTRWSDSYVLSVFGELVPTDFWTFRSWYNLSHNYLHRFICNTIDIDTLYIYSFLSLFCLHFLSCMFIPLERWMETMLTASC